MISVFQNISNAPISLTAISTVGIFPSVYQFKLSEPEETQQARGKMVQHLSQIYFDSHLGHTRDFTIFSSVIAEDFRFFSVRQHEDEAIAYNDMDKSAFLEGMRASHFDNLKEVRKLSLTDQEIIPSTVGIEDPLVRGLIEGSQRVCTLSSEQYRLGKGLKEEGEGWYKIQATLCFICKEPDALYDSMFHSNIQSIVQLDYTKTKIREEAPLLLEAVKV